VRSIVSTASGVCLAIGLMISVLPAVASGQSLDSNLRDKPIAVAVEVEGSIPGFTADQLSAYVSEQMADAHLTAWRFTPATPHQDGTEPPNRVVWHFKVLPYGGGTVRYIGPALSKARDLFGSGRPIGLDAKIYLNGQFQSTCFDQATVRGGPHDPALSDVIKKMMNTIVADAFAAQPSAGPKLAEISTIKIGSKS
jgi:hypothetical protein